MEAVFYIQDYYIGQVEQIHIGGLCKGGVHAAKLFHKIEKSTETVWPDEQFPENAKKYEIVQACTVFASNLICALSSSITASVVDGRELGPACKVLRNFLLRN